MKRGGTDLRRGIFHKYLLGFTSFFLVPMVVLSICLQIIMYRNLSREILGYNENILERLGDDLVTMNGRLMEAGNPNQLQRPCGIQKPGCPKPDSDGGHAARGKCSNPYITKRISFMKNKIEFFFPGPVAKDILLAGS